MAQKLNDAAVAVLAGARRPMTATSIARWLVAGGQFVGESEIDLAALISARLSNRDDVVVESADGATEFIHRSVRDAEVQGNQAQSNGPEHRIPSEQKRAQVEALREVPHGGR